MKGNFRIKRLHWSGGWLVTSMALPDGKSLLRQLWGLHRTEQTCISVINNFIYHVCIAEHLSWIRFRLLHLLWVSHFASFDLDDRLLTGKLRGKKNLELTLQTYSVKVPADLHAHAPAAEEFKRSSARVKTQVNLDICSRTHTEPSPSDSDSKC